MIRINNLNKTYFGGTPLHVLKGINLNIDRGEFLSIMGASGSGKSTLLNILGILDSYDTGEYFLDNVLIKNLSETKAAVVRNKKIGFIFQSFNLISFKNAMENVALPLYYQGVSRKKRNILALEYLDKMGLKSHAHHLPNEMSGGQKQRVAIARALIAQPQIILADEPTGALDSKTSEDVMHLLREINTNDGITMIIVTHEKAVAEATDRIIHIKDGVISDIEDRKLLKIQNSIINEDNNPLIRETKNGNNISTINIESNKRRITTDKNSPSKIENETNKNTPIDKDKESLGVTPLQAIDQPSVNQEEEVIIGNDIKSNVSLMKIEPSIIQLSLISDNYVPDSDQGKDEIISENDNTESLFITSLQDIDQPFVNEEEKKFVTVIENEKNILSIDVEPNKTLISLKNNDSIASIPNNNREDKDRNKSEVVIPNANKITLEKIENLDWAVSNKKEAENNSLNLKKTQAKTTKSVDNISTKNRIDFDVKSKIETKLEKIITSEKDKLKKEDQVEVKTDEDSNPNRKSDSNRKWQYI